MPLSEKGQKVFDMFWVAGRINYVNKVECLQLITEIVQMENTAQTPPIEGAGDEEVEKIVADQVGGLNRFAMTDSIEVVCRIISRRTAKAVRDLCNTAHAGSGERAFEAGMLWDDTRPEHGETTEQWLRRGYADYRESLKKKEGHIQGSTP